MNSLLAQLLWIGMAAAAAGPLLPGAIAYIMSLNRAPVLAGTAFLLGAASVALLFCVLALAILSTVATGPVSGRVISAIFLVMGIVLLSLGLKSAFTRHPNGGNPTAGVLQRSAQGGVAGLLLFGAVAQIVNFDALIVLLPGLDAIDAAGLGTAQDAADLVFLVAVLLLPAWVAVAAAALGGRPALRLLSRLGNWLSAHERAVSTVTGVGIGAIFFLRGWVGLRGGA